MYKEQFIQRFSHFLDPDECLRLAKLHGWYQRRGKIHPAEFLLGPVCGQASALHPSLSAQAQSYQKSVTRQAVDERYNQPAVDYFVGAFNHALHRSLEEQPDPPTWPLLREQFAAVRLFDSTQFVLPESLAERFPACGGGGGQAGLKVLLAYEYLRSQFEPLAVLPAKRSDQGLAGQVGACVGPNELGLFDKGFFNGAVLRALHERGGYFLLPWPRSVSVWQTAATAPAVSVSLAQRLRAYEGDRLELSEIRLGQGATALPNVRLLADRRSVESASRHRAALREKCRTYGRLPTADALELAGWHILVTNVGAEKLPAGAAIYLYRLRWQIELIFKQLKSVLRIDEVPTGKEHRLQCEVWARLLAGLMLFSWHRYTNAACWLEHCREISFAKLARRLQHEGLSLARALFLGGDQLHRSLSALWDRILKSARKGHQRSRKTTWQKLCDQWLEPRTA